MPRVTGKLGEQVVLRWAALSASFQNRLVGLSLVAGSGPVLAIAAWLEPDPAGVGTHKQLGLGGCTVLTLVGWPCPMCGMTTCFTHMAHFEPFAAVQVQPFGVLLYLVTLAAFGLGVSALAGSALWRQLIQVVLRHEIPVAAGTLIGMAAGWLYKCAVMGMFG
jgi:hypothetical protein